MKLFYTIDFTLFSMGLFAQVIQEYYDGIDLDTTQKISK